MAPTSNPKVIFNSIPQGYPKPGQDLVYETSETLDLETVSLNGGFLTKTILISPEPWLRERLRDPTKASYSTPMRLGFSVVGYGVVKVLRSENLKFAQGDYAMGLIHKFVTQDRVSAWQLYTIHPWDGLKPAASGQWPDYTVDIDNFTFVFGLNKISKNPHISLPSYVGALGGPGQTAYVGLREYAPNMKSGQVIYVSTAAGAVGLMVVQLAKIAGLKVIASTGSDEKVNYLLKEIGVDVAFNYKTTSIDSVLGKEGPIDIYWDNVGGQTLETAVEHCKVRAKIIVCGYISEYNNEQQYGIKVCVKKKFSQGTIYVLTLATNKNFHWIFKKRLQIHGLLTPDHLMKWSDKFFEEVPPLVVQGKIKTKEDLVYGLDNAAQAFVDLLQGKNLGKTVVVVSEDD